MISSARIEGLSLCRVDNQLGRYKAGFWSFSDTIMIMTYGVMINGINEIEWYEIKNIRTSSSGLVFDNATTITINQEVKSRLRDLLWNLRCKVVEHFGCI